MRLTAVFLLVSGLAVLLATTGVAGEWLHATNCVLYVRDVTGIDLQGNAGEWWDLAEGRYVRSHAPIKGAVLVFRPSSSMRVGHVAVVSRIVNKREILVDQANWTRGVVNTGMWVVDASPNNDWTSVKVEELRSQTYGRENPTFGFVYPRPAQRQPDESTVAHNERGVVHPEIGRLHLVLASAQPDAKAIVEDLVDFDEKPATATAHTDGASRKATAHTQKPSATSSKGHADAKQHADHHPHVADRAKTAAKHADKQRQGRAMAAATVSVRKVSEPVD